MADRNTAVGLSFAPPESVGIVAEETPQARMQSTLHALVGADIERVESTIHQVTQSRFPEIDELRQRATPQGGKRLRPILVLLSAATAQHGTARSSQQDLLAIAAAVELVHAASLVHDDVLDAAELRRHQPTVSSQSGNTTAVLLGDYLFTRAYATAAMCRSTRPAREIATAATGLCEGELRQQATIGDWSLTVRTYKSILAQKTASLCSVSCRLGAWHAGAERAQVRQLARFGSALGLAFQIYDDWLDSWGSEQVGKTLGTDLQQRKPTLPLLRLLATSGPKERSQLIDLLSAEDDQALQEVFRHVIESDAGEYTLRIARRLALRAVEALAGLPDSPAKECLENVARFSANRDE